VRHIGRHVVIDHDGLRHTVEVGLSVVVAQQLVDVDDIRRAIAESEAGRHVQALEDGLDLALSTLIGDGIDVGCKE
jgi:hypothetical protein